MMQILMNKEAQKLKIRRTGMPSVRATFAEVASPMFEFNMAANGIPRGVAQMLRTAVISQMVHDAFGRGH